MLEAEAHPRRCVFVTLTYDREVTSLRISDVQLWLKRLRKRCGSLRVFYCGEYGDTTQRPHYHAVLFGLPECPGGPIERVGRKSFRCLCATCFAVRETWNSGHTVVGNLTPKRAMYIAGYVVKKMTHRLDPRLEGREPEFARMSLRPGIGAVALTPVISLLSRHQRTVPGGLQYGGRMLPLGRYLRRLIAVRLTDGSNEAVQAILGVPDTVSKNKKAMSLLRAYAEAVDKPVDKVWKEVLEIPEVLKVIPVIPTIHRPTEGVRNV
nr:replication associated protein [Flumine microvirus 13]